MQNLLMGNEYSQTGRQLFQKKHFAAAGLVFTKANSILRVGLQDADLATETKTLIASKCHVVDEYISICMEKANIVDQQPKAVVEPPKPKKEQEEEDILNHLRSFQLPSDGTQLRHVIGCVDAILGIKQAVFFPIVFPERYDSRCQGILLFGPAGVGKTLVVKAVASSFNETGYGGSKKITMFKIGLGDLLQRYVGETEKYIASLFRLASRESPSIICIDEIDGILAKRSDTDSDITSRLKVALLTAMDGLSSVKDVVVVGTTNRPQLIDEAFLSRFSKRYYLALPKKPERMEILAAEIQKHHDLPEDLDLEYIATLTDGYSGRDLYNLVQVAKDQIFTDQLSAGSMKDVDRMQRNKTELLNRKLENEHFFAALGHVKASTDCVGITQLETWARYHATNGDIDYFVPIQGVDILPEMLQYLFVVFFIAVLLFIIF